MHYFFCLLPKEITEWRSPQIYLFVDYEFSSMRFFFPGMNAFRLFDLCLSRVILVGLLHCLCGLEDGIIVVMDMLLYNLKKVFVYFFLILETH